MKTAHIRFYEELNEFLPLRKRKNKFCVQFSGTPAVKDVIEAQGVPHTEIDLIIINGKSVRFSYKLKGDEEISVYPVFESFDISTFQKLRPKPLRRPKFVLDVHLGTLAKYMRMLDFDVSYRNDYTDNQIINNSLKEKRAILTRFLGILKQTRVTRGYWVRNTNPLIQIEEIVERFNLRNLIKEFTRCIRCNSLLKSIDKEKIFSGIPIKVKALQSEFYICKTCDKIYWKGTHYDKMSLFIEKLKKFKNC